MKFKFEKKQRLTHKKRITELFQQGKDVKSFPFRIKYLPNELSYHRVVITVPKRNIALACHRNTIKRKMREVFRLHQHQILKNTTSYDLVFSFYGKEIPNYAIVEEKFFRFAENINRQASQKAHPE